MTNAEVIADLAYQDHANGIGPGNTSTVAKLLGWRRGAVVAGDQKVIQAIDAYDAPAVRDANAAPRPTLLDAAEIYDAAYAEAKHFAERLEIYCRARGAK